MVAGTATSAKTAFPRAASWALEPPDAGARGRYPKTRSARMPTTGAPNDATTLSKHRSSAYTVVLAFSGTISAKIGLPIEMIYHRVS
jgi:hypothetical protein